MSPGPVDGVVRLESDTTGSQLAVIEFVGEAR
jgi:hypothetical protein